MNTAADDAEGQNRISAFLQQLHGLGWTEGRNVHVDTRWASGMAGGYRKSATELEYDAAYRDDPTKILIFCKESGEREPAQQSFVQRVGEYHRGYYMRKYQDTYELTELASASVVQWLEERAAIGRKLEYFDHFIRLAVQKSPFPGVRPTYRVDDDYIELKYRILGRSFTVHFDKALIYNDFWGCMASLESRFEEWRKESYGRRT